MKNIIKIILILSIIGITFSCETYPNWEDNVEYSDTYPLSGEYFVRDFDADTDTLVTDWYLLYIYNRSFNPDGNAIWINNHTGHSLSQDEYQFKYKISTNAQMDELSFNCTKVKTVSGASPEPADSAISVSIENSKVWDFEPLDIHSTEVDSIYFEFTYYDKQGVEIRKLKTMGHRKTGWENPQNDDDM